MKIAEATYRQVIQNALSAVEQIEEERSETDESVLEYLKFQWLPYAQDVRQTWEDEENNHPKRVI